MTPIRCAHCGELLDWNADVLMEVTGWVRYRGRDGGVNAITDRRDSGRAVHGHCYEAFKAAERGQQTLVP